MLCCADASDDFAGVLSVRAFYPIEVAEFFIRDGGACAQASGRVRSDQRYFHTAVKGRVFPAAQSSGNAFSAGAVVAGKNNQRVVVQTLSFQGIQNFAQALVEFLDAIDISVVRGVAFTAAVIVGIYRPMRPGRSVIRQELIARIGALFDKIDDLFGKQPCAFRLIGVVAVGTHFGMRFALRVVAAGVAYPIIRGHVVDVVTAVEQIEALIGRQVFAVIAQVPFADTGGSIAFRLQDFGKSYFVPQYPVHVERELIGVDEVSDRIRVGFYRRREYDVIQITPGRIPARQHAEARRRTYGRGRIEVIHNDTAVRDPVDVRSIDSGFRAAAVAVQRYIRISHIVHQDYQHVGGIGVCARGGDAPQVIVVPFLQAFHGRNDPQAHKEEINCCGTRH